MFLPRIRSDAKVVVWNNTKILLIDKDDIIPLQFSGYIENQAFANVCNSFYDVWLNNMNERRRVETTKLLISRKATELILQMISLHATKHSDRLNSTGTWMTISWTLWDCENKHLTWKLLLKTQIRGCKKLLWRVTSMTTTKFPPGRNPQESRYVRNTPILMTYGRNSFHHTIIWVEELLWCFNDVDRYILSRKVYFVLSKTSVHVGKT